MTDTKETEATATNAEAPEVRVVVAEVKAANPELAAKILKQVEFYFGNSNLPKDNHLRGLTQKNDGWVEISHIASFPKMKALSQDLNVIVSAIQGSKELLEVDPTGAKLRRKVPVPDDLDLNPFSIYVKGLPKEWAIEQVEAFFQKHLKEGEEIKCTRLRRFKDRSFKGSIFMELSSVEAAQRITSSQLKADEAAAEPLLILMKAAYFKKKQAERDADKAQRKGAAGGDKGKRKRDDDAPEGEGEQKKGFTRELTPGCIISVANLPASVDKFKLSQAIAGTGAKVAFVDLNQGTPSFVRLARDSEVSAKDVLAKLAEADFKFENDKPELTILEGDAEKAHWEKIWDAQEAHEGNRGRGRGKRGGGRGGGRGRGGRGGKKQKQDS